MHFCGIIKKVFRFISEYDPVAVFTESGGAGMELLSVREIFRNKEEYLGKEIEIGGWVRSIRIAEVLEVGKIKKIIRIEDIATEEEMKIAAEMRNKQGKHVIPVPTFELKRQFSGYFTDPLMLLFKKKGQTIMEEKTVMRPAYSYLGEYKISGKAIADICTYEAMQFSAVHKVLRVKNATTDGGRLMLDVDVVMNFPCKVSQQAGLVSDRIKEAIEEFTAITVRWVHVNVKSLNMN